LVDRLEAMGKMYLYYVSHDINDGHRARARTETEAEQKKRQTTTM